MRVLLLIGAVLVVLGLGGMARACTSSPYSVNDSDMSAPANTTPREARDNQDAEGGPMLLGLLSGLALALGGGLIAIGMGRWQRPVPSSTRPANPWNEQPADKGDPPVGLV